MDWTSDVMAGSKQFRAAIGTWATDYSVRYRAGFAPRPTLDDARTDLQQWSRTYWAGEELAAPSIS